MPHARTTWIPLAACHAAALSTVLTLASPARAEFGGTVSLQSDSRYRGISYSDHRPQGQVTVSYDGAGGWYGGGQLTQARFAGQRRSMQVQGYAGRVVGLAPGWDAEAGVTATRFDGFALYDYNEAYAGLLGDGWSARLYYSNDYYGSQQRSLYGELNLHTPLAPALQGFAHVGVIQGRGGPFSNPQGPRRLDLRLGASWRHGIAELQLAWVMVDRGGPFTWVDEGRRQTLVLGVSAAF